MKTDSLWRVIEAKYGNIFFFGGGGWGLFQKGDNSLWGQPVEIH